MEAAAQGKEVLVVIELRARFDEEANIELATLLQESGAQVVYGVVGYKTHAKMTMVIRREGRSLKRYMHLGTGNYHATTAKLYTDYGLLTDDPGLGDDVQKLFQQLTAMGRAGRLKKMLQAQPERVESNDVSHLMGHHGFQRHRVVDDPCRKADHRPNDAERERRKTGVGDHDVASASEYPHRYRIRNHFEDRT